MGSHPTSSIGATVHLSRGCEIGFVLPDVETDFRKY